MEPKQLTAQYVYDYLRRIYDRDTAIDIMDSLEHDVDGYNNLKSMIIRGELEPKKEENVS